MNEEWREIKGFDGFYEVSNIGRVRSVDRIPSAINNWARRWSGRILNAGKNNGYCVVALSKGNVRRNRLIHRLVAEAFLPNPKNLPMVNHKDCNRSNNSVDNIEWCDHAGNMRHAKEKGRMTCKNRKTWNKKLTDQDIASVHSLSAEGLTNKKIAKIYNVTSCYISEIIHHKARVGVVEIKNVAKKWTRKLSDADCAEIFRLHSSGVRQSHIAARFNVYQSHISRMIRGLARKHSELE